MNDEKLTQFLSACRAALAEMPLDSRPATRQLGRSAELCERLIGYVIAREKTGVFSQPDDFAQGVMPRAGEYAVLVDFSGEPRCLIQYQECIVLPFGAIGAEHVAVETPAMRDLEKFRQFHRNYWTPILEARGERFTQDLPIVFQRFECLYPLVPAR